jgi:hypothetical protein
MSKLRNEAKRASEKHGAYIRDSHLELAMKGVLEAVNSPRSLAVWLCLKHDQGSLLDLPHPAMHSDDPLTFAVDYMVTEYFSKYTGLSGYTVDKREVALTKWKQSEAQCADTNTRFRSSALSVAYAPDDEALLFEVRRKIARVLGPLDIPALLAGCRWSSGSTFDIPRRESCPGRKMLSPFSVTSSARPYLKAVVEADPHWSAKFLGTVPEGPFHFLPDADLFRIVRGNDMEFVPKSAKTDRIICKEPTGNAFLQQGVGRYIRRRLKRFGVDLNDQNVNQNAARMCWADGSATLDLRAASDTIATAIIYLLLPLPWANFLDDLRSKECCVDGKWTRIEKFASMGNAYIFELESLIFWALSSCTVRHLGSSGRVCVYGDDIVVPRGTYSEVVRILEWCGFTVNSEKSFSSGRFYESCGSHYYMGTDVTPVYQKETVRKPSEIIRAYNRLVRWFLRNGVKIPSSVKKIREAYPFRPFPRIPYGCVDEDGGFLVPKAELKFCPNHGYRCDVLDYVPQHDADVHEDLTYAYKLRSPQYSSPDPSGRSAVSAGGKWRTRVRYISLASTYP